MRVLCRFYAVFPTIGWRNTTRPSTVSHSSRVRVCAISAFDRRSHYWSGHSSKNNLLVIISYLLIASSKTHQYHFELQESVGIAKALAAKNGYDLDSNQEVPVKTIRI